MDVRLVQAERTHAHTGARANTVHGTRAPTLTHSLAGTQAQAQVARDAHVRVFRVPQGDGGRDSDPWREARPSTRRNVGRGPTRRHSGTGGVRDRHDQRHFDGRLALILNVHLTKS